MAGINYDKLPSAEALSVNGVEIKKVDGGLLIGSGADAIFIHGSILSIFEIPKAKVHGHYPDMYPFVAAISKPSEAKDLDTELDQNYPYDGIALDCLPAVIRALKRIVLGNISITANLPRDSMTGEYHGPLERGDLVTWDETSKQWVQATCTSVGPAEDEKALFVGVIFPEIDQIISSANVICDAWNLTPGQAYYLDCDNPGKLTSVANDYYVGVAQSKDAMYFSAYADTTKQYIDKLALQLSQVAADIVEIQSSLDAAEEELAQVIATVAKLREEADEYEPIVDDIVTRMGQVEERLSTTEDKIEQLDATDKIYAQYFASISTQFSNIAVTISNIVDTFAQSDTILRQSIDGLERELLRTLRYLGIENADTIPTVSIGEQFRQVALRLTSLENSLGDCTCEQIRAIGATSEANRQKISALETLTADWDTRLTTTAAAVNTNRESISTLGTHLQTTTGNIASLQTSMSAAQTSISVIQSDVTELKSDVSNLPGLQIIKDGIATNAQNIATLQQTTASQTTAIQGINDRLDRNEERGPQWVQDKIDSEIENAKLELSQTIDDKIATTLPEGVSALANRVDRIESDVATASTNAAAANATAATALANSNIAQTSASSAETLANEAKLIANTANSAATEVSSKVDEALEKADQALEQLESVDTEVLEGVQESITNFDEQVVHKEGDETISGVKTFTSTPLVQYSTSRREVMVSPIVIQRDLEEVSSALDTHADRTDNPHQVTAEQVGLGNLPNAISDSTHLDSSETLATSKAVKAVSDALSTLSGGSSDALQEIHTSLETAQQAATEATEAAGLASSAAEVATTKAEEAAQAATGATTTANQALTKATSAETAAGSAQTDATQALADAAAAQTTANSAQTEAATAKADAAQAKTDATTAKTDAATALTTANQAMTAVADKADASTVMKLTESQTISGQKNFTGGLLTSGKPVASQEYVGQQVANLVNSAPATLDTLQELASALGNDPNFATTVATQIGQKANLNEVVLKSGDTMTGNLTIKKYKGVIVFQHDNVYLGTFPPSTENVFAGINISDANNKLLGDIRHYYNSTGNSTIRLRVYNTDESGVSAPNATMGVSCLPDGTAYATAPTTPENATGNEIVTAGYLNTVLANYGQTELYEFSHPSANRWAKCGTFTCASTGREFSLLLAVHCIHDNPNSVGILDINLRSNRSNGKITVVSNYFNFGFFAASKDLNPDNFALVITEGESQAVVDFYIRQPISSYHTFIKVLNKIGGYSNWNINFIPTDSSSEEFEELPAGDRVVYATWSGKIPEGCVSIAGEQSITGAKTFTSHTIFPSNISLQNTNMEIGAAISNAARSFIHFCDKNKINLMTIYSQQATNTVYGYFQVHTQKEDDTRITATIALSLSRNGTTIHATAPETSDNPNNSEIVTVGWAIAKINEKMSVSLASSSLITSKTVTVSSSGQSTSTTVTGNVSVSAPTGYVDKVYGRQKGATAWTLCGTCTSSNVHTATVAVSLASGSITSSGTKTYEFISVDTLGNISPILEHSVAYTYNVESSGGSGSGGGSTPSYSVAQCSASGYPATVVKGRSVTGSVTCTNCAAGITGPDASYSCKIGDVSGCSRTFTVSLASGMTSGTYSVQGWVRGSGNATWGRCSYQGTVTATYRADDRGVSLCYDGLIPELSYSKSVLDIDGEVLPSNYLQQTLKVFELMEEVVIDGQVMIAIPRFYICRKRFGQGKVEETLPEFFYDTWYLSLEPPSEEPYKVEEYVPVEVEEEYEDIDYTDVEEEVPYEEQTEEQRRAGRRVTRWNTIASPVKKTRKVQKVVKKEVEKKDEFYVHPAFTYEGEHDWIFIGKYPATVSSLRKDDQPLLESLPKGKKALYNLEDYDYIREMGRNRNKDGVDGFHTINVHEGSLLYLLQLVYSYTQEKLGVPTSGEESFCGMKIDLPMFEQSSWGANENYGGLLIMDGIEYFNCQGRVVMKDEFWERDKDGRLIEPSHTYKEYDLQNAYYGGIARTNCAEGKANQPKTITSSFYAASAKSSEAQFETLLNDKLAHLFLPNTAFTEDMLGRMEAAPSRFIVNTTYTYRTSPMDDFRYGLGVGCMTFDDTEGCMAESYQAHAKVFGQTCGAGCLVCAPVERPESGQMFSLADKDNLGYLVQTRLAKY